MPGFHTQIAHLSRLIQALESNVISLNQRVKLLEDKNKILRSDWRDLIKTIHKAQPDILPKPKSIFNHPSKRSYLEIHPDDKRMVESVIQAVLQLGPGVYSIPHLLTMELFPSLSPTVLGKILKDYPEYFRPFRTRVSGSEKRVNFVEVLGTHHAPPTHPL